MDRYEFGRSFFLHTTTTSTGGIESTEDDTGGDTSSTDNSGYFTNILTWLSTIAESIAKLPSNIEGFFTDLRDALTQRLIDLIKGVTELPEKIGAFIENVKKSIGELPEKIGEFIKGLFVPEEGYIEKKIEEIKKMFLGIGSQSFDMTAIFDKEQPFEDIKCTIMGVEVTIVKFDAVDTALDYFRPIIQGLMYLLLIIYNLNQFFAFIGQEGIAVGSAFYTSLTKGSEKE